LSRIGRTAGYTLEDAANIADHPPADRALEDGVARFARPSHGMIGADDRPMIDGACSDRSAGE
jgi:hypothetical protein